VRPTVRIFATAASILFLLSWVFPLRAGLAKDPSGFPKWWGAVDVGLAFVLAIAAFAIQALVRKDVDKRDVETREKDTTYRVYRIFTHALLGVAVLVMLAGDRIQWANCATGFLWRAWLGLYILPWWLTALRSPNASGNQSM